MVRVAQAAWPAVSHRAARAVAALVSLHREIFDVEAEITRGNNDSKRLRR